MNKRKNIVGITKKYTGVKISQGCWLNNPVTTLLTWQNRIGKITVLFNHVSTYCYSLANRQGLFAYVRTCKTRLDTTTKFMVVVVTSLFNLVISSFPDNMYSTNMAVDLS